MICYKYIFVWTHSGNLIQIGSYIWELLNNKVSLVPSCSHSHSDSPQLISKVSNRGYEICYFYFYVVFRTLIFIFKAYGSYGFEESWND